MVIDIFTDGSSLIDKGYYESASAIVIYIDQKLYMEAGKFHVGGTISLGELFAMKMAYKQLFKLMKECNLNKDDIKVNIYSDSAYVVNSLTKFIKSWVKQGKDTEWKNSEKKPVAWQGIFKTIYFKYMSEVDFNLKIFKVNGHVGEKISFDAAWKKFHKNNDVRVDKEEFEWIVYGNHIVDRVVEDVRINRLYKYKRYAEGINKCNHSLVITTENIILIPKRKEK